MFHDFYRIARGYGLITSKHRLIGELRRFNDSYRDAKHIFKATFPQQYVVVERNPYFQDATLWIVVVKTIFLVILFRFGFLASRRKLSKEDRYKIYFCKKSCAIVKLSNGFESSKRYNGWNLVKIETKSMKKIAICFLEISTYIKILFKMILAEWLDVQLFN